MSKPNNLEKKLFSKTWLATAMMTTSILTTSLLPVIGEAAKSIREVTDKKNAVAAILNNDTVFNRAKAAFIASGPVAHQVNIINRIANIAGLAAFAPTNGIPGAGDIREQEFDTLNALIPFINVEGTARVAKFQNQIVTGRGDARPTLAGISDPILADITDANLGAIATALGGNISPVAGADNNAKGATIRNTLTGRADAITLADIAAIDGTAGTALQRQARADALKVLKKAVEAQPKVIGESLKLANPIVAAGGANPVTPHGVYSELIINNALDAVIANPPIPLAVGANREGLNRFFSQNVAAFSNPGIQRYNILMPFYNAQLHRAASGPLRHTDALTGYNHAVRDAARNDTVANGAVAAIGGIDNARVKALSRLDAAAVAGLGAADIATYNTVMAEYNRQVALRNVTAAQVAAATDLARVIALQAVGGGNFDGRGAEVQNIANRRLAAGGAPAVFDIAAVLARGAAIAGMDLAATNTYRDSLALLEASVDEDKAVRLGIAAKAARKSNGDAAKERAKVDARVAAEAALTATGNPAFIALGVDAPARQTRIRDIGKRDALAIEVLTPAELKLHNTVMAEYNRQVALRNVAAAQVAAATDLARVIALQAVGGGNFDGRGAEVQNIANRRLAAGGAPAVFDIAAVLARGAAIAGMDLAATNTYRDSLALLEASVDEDKAVRLGIAAKAARKSNGDAAKERAKVDARVAAEAALTATGNPAFIALGVDAPARQTRIRDIGKRDALAIEVLTPAELKLHNTVMAEYNRQVALRNVAAAQVAAATDLARVIALQAVGGGNFDGRGAEVQNIANRRLAAGGAPAVFDIAAVLARGAAIAGMDLAATNTYRDSLALLEASVDEDKAVRLGIAAKAARKSNGDAAKERAKVDARVAAEAALTATGNPAFIALGVDAPARQTRIRDIGKRDALAIEVLTPAELKLHNTVMAEYNRQVALRNVAAAQVAAATDLARVIALQAVGGGNFDGRGAEVQNIANRRLAAGGAPAVFDIAAVLARGAAIAGMDLAATNTYRDSLALLEASVDEDKAVRLGIAAKAARKSNGDAAKERAKVDARVAAEAALTATGNPAFIALGVDAPARQTRIRDIGKRDALAIEVLTPAELKLHNTVMAEYNRQVALRNVAAAQVAAATDLARVIALQAVGGGNFDGRGAEVQNIANRRLAAGGAPAVFDIAAVLARGAAIAGMDLAATNTYRDSLALLEASVDEDKAVRLGIAAKAARKSNGDAAKERAKVDARVAAEAALTATGNPAFIALGVDAPARQTRIRDIGKRDALAIEVLTPAELKLHNTVMAEYNRQVALRNVAAAQVAAATDLARVIALQAVGGGNFDGRGAEVQNIANRRLAAGGAPAVFDIAAVLARGAAIAGMDLAATNTYRDSLALLEASVDEDKAVRLGIAAKAARKSNGDAAKERAKVDARVAAEAALTATGNPAFIALGVDAPARQTRIRDIGKRDALAIEVLTPAELKLHNTVMAEYNRQVALRNVAAAQVAAATDLARVIALQAVGGGNFDGRGAEVQNIANRRLAAGGAPAVFDIAAVLARGAAIAGMDLAATNTYRDSLALLEASVDEDKAVRLGIAAKAARKSNGDAAKERAKVDARVAAEAALTATGNPAFIALGVDAPARQTRIRDIGKRDALAIEVLTPAELKLHNTVMAEYNRQVALRNVAAARAKIARNHGAVHTTHAAVIANLAAYQWARSQVVDEAVREGIMAGLPRNVLEEFVDRAMALNIAAGAHLAIPDEATSKLVSKALKRMNHYLGHALAAINPHVPAPGNPAPGNPAPAPQEPAARTVTSAVIDNAGRLAMVSVAAPTAVHAAAIESTSRSTVAIVNSDNKTGVREEFAFAAAKKTGLSEEKIKKVVDRTPEQIAALSKEEVKEHKEVAEAISASGTLEAIIKKAEKEAVKTEVRTEAWKELGVDRKDVADAAPAQHVQFVAKLEQAPKMEGKVASIAQDAIADPTKVENLEKAALSLKKITRSESLDKLSEAAKDDAAVASASNAVKSLLYSASMSKNYSSSEERKAAIDKTVAQATETAASVSSHVSSAVSNIVSRIDALSFSNVAQLADSGLGASAGDDSVFAKAGVWVSGIYGQSKQGSVNSKSGYKGNLYGGSAGADLELGESIVLGGAYSNVSSDFKYSGGNKIGDKTDVKSHVFSIYAQTSLSQDIAWNNIVSLSRSNVEGKRNAEGKSVASGKSKSEGLSFETNLGYKIVQDDIMLVPSIGLRYGYFKDKGYTETGAGVHNITQSASSSKILTGILGAKVMWNTKVGDASFSPYLQGSIDHNFSHKGGNVNAKYTWMENYFASKAETENKPEKTAYNVGVGALMKQNNVELTLGYNLNLAKKYQSHQGTVKLKVSF